MHANALNKFTLFIGHIMNTHKESKGFTLVEMLIVIAIIGVLASITYASLSGARERAKDRTMVADMNSLLIESRLFRSSNGSYTGLCGDTGTQMGSLLARIGTLAPSAPNCSVSGTGNAFAVTVQLHSGNCYCVDSTNFFSEIETSTCIPSNFACPAGS